MSTRNHRRQLLALSIVVALTTVSMATALAQDAQTSRNAGNDTTAQTDADSDKPTTLSEITVRAQKRSELLQDVPITLTTLPEQILRDTGVHNIKDVQTLVPALSVTSTTSETQTPGWNHRSASSSTACRARATAWRSAIWARSSKSRY